MTKYFTTNGRVVSEIFASYRNTFYALLELINNSIQARASKIEITLNAYDTSILSATPFMSISVKDNGIGVHSDDIEAKLLDIGTTEKDLGYGIGRFAAFQIGRLMHIETVGIKNGKKTKSRFTVNAEQLKKYTANTYPVDIETEETEENTYYQVDITGLYTKEDTEKTPKRKISKELLLENIYEQLFLQYTDSIINSKIQFIVNNKEICIQDFTIGKIDTTSFMFETKDSKNEISITALHYKAKKAEIIIDYRINNNGVLQQICAENFKIDIPDENGWRFFVDSDCMQMTDGIYRNLAMDGLDDEAEQFKEKTKNEVKKYFKTKFADYYNFSQKLKNDEYYPYRKNEGISKSQAGIFNQLAYCLEDEYNLIANQSSLRKVIYPLVNLALANGDLHKVLETISFMKSETITKLKKLIEKVDFENVIAFSNDIADKTTFLDVLYKLVYSPASKDTKERSQLHKIIEKQLWIFGEQYSRTPKLFSDKNLENNLLALRNTYLVYEPSKSDDNLIEDDTAKSKGITDLFFFNEKIIYNDRREIMIVELKSPRCAIGQKELNQVDRYLVDIENSAYFSKSLDYKIILVSSKLNKFAKSKVGQFDRSDKHLYTRSQSANISIYVYQWSDLIAENRTKLSFLGDALQVQDYDIHKFIDEQYNDCDIDKIFPTAVFNT